MDFCGIFSPAAATSRISVTRVGVHLDNGFLKELGVGQVNLVCHVLLVDAHRLFENQAVEHADVKLLRSLAHIGQHLAHHADVLQGQQIPLALAAVERERLFALVVFFGEKGVHVADGGIFFDLKIGLAAREHIMLVKIGQVAHHAVCREHHQARVLHVHEIDHLIILQCRFRGSSCDS